MLAVLGRSWGLYGRSRARKCEEHGYLENMLISRAGARSAAWGSVLSCSWGLCGRSWAALGTYVGGLVPLSGPKLAVLGGLGAKVVGLGSDQGEKWPKPEREHDLCWRSCSAPNAGRAESECPERPERWARRAGPDRPEGPVRIFSVDICI